MICKGTRFMNYNSSGDVFEQEGGGGESCPWARPCYGCHAAPSVVYCHADVAYLCASCDTRVHAANRVASRHERVCICEACERLPAVLACRADAASLCAICDAQVHSANPLAGRHQRVPVLPLPAAAIPAASVLAEVAAASTALAEKEEEVDSWLLLGKNSNNSNCNTNNKKNLNNSGGSNMYFAEVDEYFDLVGYNSYCDNHINNSPEQYGIQEQQEQQQQQLVQKEFEDNEGSEFVVPSQVAMANKQQQNYYGGAEHAASVTAGVSTYTDSISNSLIAGSMTPAISWFSYFSDDLPIPSQISFSSMEVGIVPDNMAMDMTSHSILTPTGVNNLFSGSSLQMPLHFSSMEREARVHRYREKKKNRKFKKTIRYATRKTYAEARPRIKGRFAKRSDMEEEADQMFSTAALSDGSYGTVLWF